MPVTVGLTGGIASGKSTVAGILRKGGIPVLDLDQVARQVVEPGEPALAEIGHRWPEVMDAEGRLNRKALGAKIVADPEAKRELERILHPRIWERMEQWIAGQSAPVVVIEASLMVETGSWCRYDHLIVVSASPEVQRRRLAKREGYDVATVDRWLAAQLPASEKEKVATVVIRNDGGMEELERAVWEGWRRLGIPEPASGDPSSASAPTR